MLAKLEGAKKVRLNGERKMVRTSPSEKALLMDLSALENPVETPNRGPGRPEKMLYSPIDRESLS